MDENGSECENDIDDNCLKFNNRKLNNDKNETDGLKEYAKNVLKSRNNRKKEHHNGGDYLIEINGNQLSVLGQGALRFIDRPWNPNKARQVTSVKFSSLDFNCAASIMGKMKTRFPHAEYFHFIDTNISCFGQLNSLADLQGLTSLSIDPIGNPLYEKQWRTYAIYRLSHWGLKHINGSQITIVEITSSDIDFRGLSDLVISCLPDNLLEPLLDRLQISGQMTHPREWLDLTEPSIRTVVAKEALQWRKTKQEYCRWREKGKIHLENIIVSTLSTLVKLKSLNKEWTSILKEIIRDTLVDYSHIESYMKQCISQINL